MAHARRKFHELHVTGQSLISIEALELFQSLYAVEREIDEQFEKNQTPLPRDAQIVRGFGFSQTARQSHVQRHTVFETVLMPQC